MNAVDAYERTGADLRIASTFRGMFAATDAWSGWASTVLGGVLSAATVLIGVWLGFRNAEKTRLANWRQNEHDKARFERRAAAAQLMVELSNLRDAVCSRTTGLSGEASLWHMRNTLFTTHIPLSKYPSYHAVRGFYETASTWRDWVRATQATVAGPAEVHLRYPIVDEYREALRRYGDEVIELLQNRLEDVALDYTPPKMPALPILPDPK